MKAKHIEIIKEVIGLTPKDADVKTMRTMILAEELAELTAAIMQHARKPEDMPVEKLTEEIADAYITLEGYKIAFGIADETVEDAIDAKAKKLADRMELVKQGKVYY